MPNRKKIRQETRRETTIDREERVKIKIEFNLKRVQRLVQLPRTEIVHKALAYHRDQITRLHKIQKGFIKERKRVRNAMLLEIEQHCWTMMQGHGFDDLLTSDDAPNRDPPNLGDQDQMAIDQPTNNVANVQFDWSQTSRVVELISHQEDEERARLTAGQQPHDPFAPIEFISDKAFATLPHQLVLLGRLRTTPQLIDAYPYTKAYLEEPPLDSNHDRLQSFRKDAISAIEAYKKQCEADMKDVQSTEKQKVRARISNSSKLWPMDKFILTLATFIPQGSYTTYAAIREWASDAGNDLDDQELCSALRRASRAFGIREVPSYRVIKANNGPNQTGCDWGDHLPDFLEQTRIELFEHDKIEFDKQKRMLGGRPFTFYKFRDLMRGTTMEEWVDKLPSRPSQFEG